MTRGKQKLTTEQRSLIERGKKSYEAWIAAEESKARRLATFEAELDAENEGVRVRWLLDAHAIREGGVPMTHLAQEVLGQRGTAAAYAAVSEGARYAGAVAAENAGPAAGARFERDDRAITFTPTPEELAVVLERIGLEPEGAPTSAQFEVRDGIITPITPRITPAGVMHPVVALVMADGSKVGRELVEFAAPAA